MTKSNAKKAPGNEPVAQLKTKRSQPNRLDPEPEGSQHEERIRQPAVMAPELHVHQFLGILARRRVLIAVTVLLGALLAGAATALIPPKFTARAQIVVEPERTLASGTEAVRTASVDASAIDTQMTMLAARDHLRAVLASLADDPAFAVAPPEQRSGLDTNATMPVEPTAQKQGYLAELELAATGFLADVRGLIWQQTGVPAFDEFERTLRIDQERQSRIISVRYTSDSAVQASTLANRVVELYVRAKTDNLRQAAKAELAELGARIANAETSLEAAEATIREKLEASQDVTGAGQVSGTPLRQLQREVSETAQLYVTLLARQKQLRAQRETTDASVRVLSLAEPPELPSSADAKFFILPAIILSLIGGCVLAVIMERFDRTLRSEHQVHGALGIPCCALAPKISWLHRSRPHDHLLKKPFSPYAEAIRSIGASLQFATPQRSPQIVLISSSVRGEGRTTLATSLAAYATRLQPRVLLVDLDFRHPAVARALTLKPKTGVLDLIVSSSPIEDVVQHIPRLGLDVLAMPSCTVDPVTLFANGKLQNVLNELRSRYDFIVIDGPPLIGVTESCLLASLADTVLFVIKWGSTRRDVAQNAISELEALGWSDRTIAERVRAVVTHVDLKRHASYQYGDAVELLVRGGNHYNSPRSVSSLADLRKAKEGPDGGEESIPVAAE